ncbi:AAA family ATPase [Arenimonas sp.]|nr:AAA family ATPase [Candidatus Parcubacteria bacterium]
MRLKSLHIIGYKSFAKKTDLVFNTPITSIVGPNGSGKSNVVEAFRFVLGEQSLRSMRGKKGEDMIFNGGCDLSKSNRASVKIVFDNRLLEENGEFNRLFNTHTFDEVTIERAVNRDGTNEYSINGNSVRLRDIIELLAEANIGSSGHHIISQGEADRLLSSSNKDRKEMIEEALGLKLYQYRKEESQKRLVKTNEHMKEVESLRRELAPHIRFLKKQIEKIEKAREIRNELKNLYKEYFAYEKVFLDSEKNDIKESCVDPERELSSLDSKLTEVKKILAQNQTSTEFTNELFTLEGELKNIRFNKETLSREIGRFEGEINYINKNIDKRKLELENKENVDIKVSFFEIKNLINKIKTVLSDIKSGVYKDESEIKEVSSDLINDCETYVKSKHNESESIDFEPDFIEIDRIKLLITNIEDDIQALNNKEINVLDKYTDTKNKIESFKNENVEAEKDLLKIMSRQHEIQSELDKLKVRENFYTERNQEYENEMMEATALIGVEAIRFTDVEAHDFDKQKQYDRKHQVDKFKIRLEELGGAGDESVVKEYNDVNERDEFLLKEMEDLTKSMQDLEQLITEVVAQINTLFDDGVKKINLQFSTFFKQMFGGGEARLVITEEKKRKKRITDIDDDEDMEESEDESETKEYGIDVFVSLPHKKLKGLSMLSGGERALTSIALLFAMSQVNPPPFIILDETDAALDEANSRRYGDMIELLSKHSELILVTHNRETMSRAGVLYGVTMGSVGYSQLLSIGFEEASLNAK